MSDIYEAMRTVPGFETSLFKAGGSGASGQHRIAALDPSTELTTTLQRLVRVTPFGLQSGTFFCSLLPWLFLGRPQVVYTGDYYVARLCVAARRRLNLSFGVCFHNGGQVRSPLHFLDQVQQTAPMHLDYHLANGGDARRQRLLPHFIPMPLTVPQLSRQERAALRRSLGLPEGRPVVLSVGVLNRAEKRMDYVISEVARLPTPRPFLVMLGQWHEDTNALYAEATASLGAGGFLMRTVRRQDVGLYYLASDLFALASQSEGFGLVYVEAMSRGLAALAHDFSVTRYVIADPSVTADLSRPGELARLIVEHLPGAHDPDLRASRHHSVSSRFSWDALRPQYESMFRSVRALGRATVAAASRHDGEESVAAGGVEVPRHR